VSAVRNLSRVTAPANQPQDTMNAAPYLSCPRFECCSANDCPLDPESAMHGGPRQSVLGEETCRAHRAVRERVAAAHGLPLGFALLPHERERDAHRARWMALPPEVRERRTAGLRRGTALPWTGVFQERAVGRSAGTPGEVPEKSPVSDVSASAQEHERRAA
jgi:hypothetical protein